MFGYVTFLYIYMQVCNDSSKYHFCNVKRYILLRFWYIIYLSHIIWRKNYLKSTLLFYRVKIYRHLYIVIRIVLWGTYAYTPLNTESLILGWNLAITKTKFSFQLEICWHVLIWPVFLWTGVQYTAHSLRIHV